MRPDMKHLFSEVRGCGRGYGTKRSTRARIKFADPENLPKFLSNRYVRDRQANVRYDPLTRFLKTNIGRPWNDVYSEIMEHCDHRSKKDYPFLNAVRRSTEEPYPWRYHHGPYVDDNGILQYRHYPKYPRPVFPVKFLTRDFEVINPPFRKSYRTWGELPTLDEWFELRESADEPKRKAGWVSPPPQWYKARRIVKHYKVWEYIYVDAKRVPVKLVPDSSERVVYRQVKKKVQDRIQRAVETKEPE